MPDFDVIISGLGPTGAVLAGLLGQRGVRVAVFEAMDDLYPLPRAIGLDHEAMRIIQELGLSRQIAGIVDRYRPSEYLGMDGKLIKRLDTEPPPHRLGWEPNYVFNQPRFEALIRARLDTLSNVCVFKPTEVTRLSQSEDCVTIRVMHHRERREETYSASFLVACDGGSSPIRKSLGLELEDLGFDEPWLVVDAIVPDSISERLPQTQVQYCEADRPCTFVVCTGRHRRWEIMLNEDEYRTGNFPDEMLWPILSRWVKPGEVELWRRAAYRFHGLIARQWRKGCVFLAGDAAHMTPPFMAQGMVQGLRDAHNLAWKLAYVLKGQAIASLLDSYETERKPHVRATTRKAMELGRLICERDPDKARQRDQKLRDEQGGVIRTTFRQQMIPGLTTGLICASQAHAGQLFLQPRISNAQGDVRLDDCVSREFVLFVLAFEFTDDLQLLQAAIGDSPIQMVLVSGDRAEADSTVTSVSSSMLACWMRDQGAPIVLVRPDKYVFGHASTTSTALELLSELKGRLR